MWEKNNIKLIGTVAHYGWWDSNAQHNLWNENQQTETRDY